MISIHNNNNKFYKDQFYWQKILKKITLKILKKNRKKILFKSKYLFKESIRLNNDKFDKEIKKKLMYFYCYNFF